MSEVNLYEIFSRTGYIECPHSYDDIARLASKNHSSEVLLKLVSENVIESASLNNVNIDCWNYSLKFISDMSHGLVRNNQYFLKALKYGLVDPMSNIPNENVKLISQNPNSNRYGLIRNIYLKGEHKFLIDFVLLINKLPIVSVIRVDKRIESIREVFDYLIDNIDQHKDYFSFCKFIVLTDGKKLLLGNFYDLYEELILFSEPEEQEGLPIELFTECISTTNIVKCLFSDDDNGQLVQSLKTMNEKTKDRIIFDHNPVSINENYDDFFIDDIQELLKDADFQEQVESTIELAEFKENRTYLNRLNDAEGPEQRRKALDLIVRANLKLVVKIANQYKGAENTVISFDDLYQSGIIGLMRAAERFDLQHENQFSTYATYWIKQSITRFIMDSALTIRLPVHVWEEINRLKKHEELSKEACGEFDYEWIAKSMGISNERVEILKGIRNTYMSEISLDTYVGEDEGTTLGEFVTDENANIENEICNDELARCVENVLSEFDERTRLILCKRFGLQGYEAMTLEEIGQDHGVTRERIRQIEKRALTRAKYLCQLDDMHIFMEDL